MTKYATKLAINKTALNVARKFSLMCLLAGITSSYAAQIYIDSDTFLKTSTAQASSLPASSKCAFTKGQSFEIRSIADGGASHWQVVLPRAYNGCALTSGFIYQPHVATESTTLSVRVPTVFKKTTASASTLPASSKCDMPTNVYPLSAPATTNAAHFNVNLKTLLPNCAFSLGFVYDGHSSTGILQMSLAGTAILKKTAVDPATLPATDKCDLAKGNYVLSAQPTRTGTHYSVTMVANPAGCAFKTGFVSYETTYFAGPAFNPADYTAPLANGIAGPGDQAWCVCRNVGTSPHIGQDWNADLAENSVAIANGSVVDKTFSTTCGHTLTVRDTGGADWIYRHLNQNSIQIGQTVTKGQFLGSHSTYPTSSCGTGPHLHIERRSAGAFGDSEVFKACEAGPEACNYNPNSPFQAPKVASISRVENMTATGEIVARSTCRVNPEQYAVVETSSLADYAQAPQDVTLATERNKRVAKNVISIAAALASNAQNRCGRGLNCLTSLSVLAETADGKLVRMFHDSTVRNRAAAVIADEGYCLPANATGRGIVLITDQAGARYRQDVMFK